MGVSLKTNIIENMLLYFTYVSDEPITEFTLDEIRKTFTSRYSWRRDEVCEKALNLLINERCSREQPGLIQIEGTEKYKWQEGVFDGSIVKHSNFITASTINGDHEEMKFSGFKFNIEQIYADGRAVFERLRGENFDSALEREDREVKARFGEDTEEEIPF